MTILIAFWVVVLVGMVIKGFLFERNLARKIDEFNNSEHGKYYQLHITHRF